MLHLTIDRCSSYPTKLSFYRDAPNTTTVRLPNETVHGKIIVHDRNRVQSEVLPVYFNHASFASLRRQLSYFSFVRVGKSRQSGVTYTNDAVVDLSDVLRLKRRAATAAAGTAGQQGQTTVPLQAGLAAVRSQQLQKRAKDQQEPQPLRKQQQRQHQEHLANVSVDVAEAVLSGTLNAAKTNHNLDSNNGGGTPPTAKSPTSTPLGHRRSTVTSYADSSMSQSSDNDASKDAASKKDCGGNNDNENNGSAIPEENMKKMKSNAFNKSRHHKRASSSMVKHPIARKDRARFERMLSVNVIVPFIHLPAGHSSRRKKKSMMVVRDPIGSGRDASATNENVAQMIDRATSDAAINALLALGSNCQ